MFFFLLLFSFLVHCYAFFLLNLLQYLQYNWIAKTIHYPALYQFIKKFLYHILNGFFVAQETIKK